MRRTHSTQLRIQTAVLAVVCAALGSPLAAGADTEVWPDFEARIQYAYFTEDARALRGLAELLEARDNADPWGAYYVALANYRLASLPGIAEPALGEAAERCVSAAERAVTEPESAVEAEILQSACLDGLAKAKPLRAALAAPRARKRLAHALAASPDNPRALLIQATTQASGDTGPPLGKALARFERERQSISSGPSWGGAEGYLALSRMQLARGEVLAARDSIEHALLLAPDFAAAHEVMKQIIASSSLHAPAE